MIHKIWAWHWDLHNVWSDKYPKCVDDYDTAPACYVNAGFANDLLEAAMGVSRNPHNQGYIDELDVAIHRYRSCI